MFKINISFYKRKKEIFTKLWTLHERIAHIKKKGKIHIMSIFYFLNICKRWSVSSQKNYKIIFSLAWGTIFTQYRKVLVFNFSKIGYTAFLYPKRWCKMIFSSAWSTMFTENWKVLVFNFSKMKNMVSSWFKKLMKCWFLLGNFQLYMIFQDLGSMAFGAVLKLLKYQKFNSNFEMIEINAEIFQMTTFAYK